MKAFVTLLFTVNVSNRQWPFLSVSVCEVFFSLVYFTQNPHPSRFDEQHAAAICVVKNVHQWEVVWH